MVRVYQDADMEYTWADMAREWVMIGRHGRKSMRGQEDTPAYYVYTRTVYSVSIGSSNKRESDLKPRIIIDSQDKQKKKSV